MSKLRSKLCTYVTLVLRVAIKLGSNLFPQHCMFISQVLLWEEVVFTNYEIKKMPGGKGRPKGVSLAHS